MTLHEAAKIMVNFPEELAARQSSNDEVWNRYRSIVTADGETTEDEDIFLAAYWAEREAGISLNGEYQALSDMIIEDDHQAGKAWLELLIHQEQAIIHYLETKSNTYRDDESIATSQARVAMLQTSLDTLQEDGAQWCTTLVAQYQTFRDLQAGTTAIEVNMPVTAGEE